MRELIDEEVPTRQGRGAHVGTALAPFGRYVEAARHCAGRAVKDKGPTGDFAIKIGAVMVEINGGSGPKSSTRVAPHPTRQVS